MITYQVMVTGQAALKMLDTDEQFAKYSDVEKLASLDVGQRSLLRLVENQVDPESFLLGVVSAQIADDLDNGNTNLNRLKELAPISELERWDDEADAYYLSFGEEVPEGTTIEEINALGAQKVVQVMDEYLSALIPDGDEPEPEPEAA